MENEREKDRGKDRRMKKKRIDTQKKEKIEKNTRGRTEKKKKGGKERKIFNEWVQIAFFWNSTSTHKVSLSWRKIKTQSTSIN